jgi:hypothetical protein
VGGVIVNQARSFDGELQMFREAPRPVNLAHLRFLRWLVDQGRLEHSPAGASSGELAEPLELEVMLAPLND